MKLKRGSTSVRRLIFVADSSSTTGAGLANLVYNTASLVAYYFAGDLSNEVQITLATATLGTWTSGGFVAVDNTNMPGWYEIGIPDAALDGGNECSIQLRGATNMVPVNIYIELDAVDYQTAVFGASTLTQTQVTGGAYALNSSSFAFNASLDFTTTQKAATLARVTLVDTTTTNTDMRGTDNAMLAASYSAPPSAATISTQVAADLLAAHGSGSWQTATGFSTPTNVTDAQAAILDKLPAALESGRISAVLDSATGTQITAIETFATRVTTGIVQDGAVWQFTANMLELGPSSSGGDATLAKQTEILAAIQGSAVIQVASPNISGNLVLTQGDDYDGTANPRASWTVSTDYTDGWSVTLTIRDVDDAVVYTTAGTVVSATVVAVTIAAPTGLTMTGCPGQWQGKFDVELTHSSGKKKTIALGVCYINEDQTR